MRLPPTKCHCGRHLAVITAPDSLWQKWNYEAEGGNHYWLNMAEEFCEPCWDARCDTAEATCP